MAEYFDQACEIYNLWHLNIKPNVKQEVSTLFELGIEQIKNNCQTKNYNEALEFVRVLRNGIKIAIFRCIISVSDKTKKQNDLWNCLNCIGNTCSSFFAVIKKTGCKRIIG